MQFSKPKFKTSTTGGVLLLSLMVMTGIITISFATGTLIMSEIQQSSQLDRAMVAYYAAESAVEKGLYQVRQRDIHPSSFNLTEVLLDNNAEYKIIAQDTEPVIYKTLAQDEILELDLYTPHSLTPFETPIKSLIVNWSAEAGSWLEVRWVPWTIAGELTPGTDQGIKISLDNLIEDLGYVINLGSGDTYLYNVRMTARYAPITYLEIVAYDTIDPQNDERCDPLGLCAVGIAGRVKIKGLGAFPADSSQPSKQAILVTMPEVAPLSGLYDYVLFSEAPIVKY
ncbi:hypothetical protein KJ840_04440 [Patescibacteria group bacterium]|nr:hypothetical protein [Patescibacteria group bacterium]